MRKFYFVCFIAFIILLSGCESTKTTDIEETVEDVVLEIEEPEETESVEVIEEEPEEETIVEEYIDSDDVEFIDDDVEYIEEPDDEYLRSIGELESEEDISQEEFFEDKGAILQIIDELSVIMEETNVEEWLKYLDPESKKYYSNPANLRKAQRKLPNRLIELKNIKDYFIYVFIPARMASQVDEIRYISKTEVKAVEVKDEDITVVYYYFKKIKDKWYINIPPVI